MGQDIAGFEGGDVYEAEWQKSWADASELLKEVIGR
jgi:hypothetical protein